MERVPVFLCILGTIHIVQGQAGYFYNRPNDPINEGTVATLPVPSGFQPATTKSPDGVDELGKAQNSVDGFPGAHLPGQTLGNGDYHSEKQSSFQSGFREDSRHLTGPEPSESPGSYPIRSENSLSQTTSSGFSGHPLSTVPSEEPRPQGYYQTVDSLNPPGSKAQGAQPSPLPGSQEDSNRFNGNQIQNTYSAGHPGTQNHGLTTSDQTGSTESSLLPTGQYGTTVPSFPTGPTSFPTHLQEGLSFTTFNAGQTHHHDTSDLGLSYGGGGDSDDGSYEGGDYSAIPGEPGIDYPIFSDIPQTSFRCEEQQWPGYYADVEARCQLFHICTNNTSYDFLCPNGTVFSQEYFVCVWWNQFNCNNAPNFFYLNEKIYDYTIMGSQLTEGNFQSFPGVSPPENIGGLQVLQGTNANLDGSKLSLESSAVPREPPTSLQPSIGTNGQNAPLGGPSIALFGHNVPLGQTNGPSGPTASFVPSTSFQPFAGPHGPTGTLGPTESFGPTPISQGPSGSFELSAVPQGPSTSLQPSTGPRGPTVIFGSTASFPGPGGSFESSTVPQRPATTFYPSTGPYSQNEPAGQSNGPLGPTGSFEPNPSLEQSNGSLVPFGSNESSSGPRGPFGLKATPHRPGVPFESSAVPQKPSTLYQPSTGPYSYNVPIGQPNGPLGPTASSGPSTSLQPFAGPQGPTGPVGLTESFSSAPRPQGPSGSFESSAIPQKPSTPFQPSTGPYSYNAPLGQSNGPVEPASSFGPNAPLSPSNHLGPFGHESSSGAQGSTASFGSAETPHRSAGSFGSSVVHQEPSTSFQPSAGPNDGNAPLEQSYGPAGPAPSFGPNAPLAQSNVPFGPPAPQQSSSGAQDPTAYFSSTETPYGPGGSFESTEVSQKPSIPFQTSTGPYHYNAPLGQSYGPTGPTASFEPDTPLGQRNGPAGPGTTFGPNAQLQPSNEPSAGPQGPTSVQLLTGPNGQNAPLGQSNGPVRPDASFDPNASLGQSNRPFRPATLFQPTEGPQEPTGLRGQTKLFGSTPLLQGPSGPFQPSTGPYSYNAPVGQSNGPVEPGASFGSNTQLQPSNKPSEGPQGGPTTSFQSFTGPNGPNAPLGQSNGPFGPSTSFQPPVGPQKPTGPQGQTESFGSTPLPQMPSGSFESSAVPQEPSTSFQPFTEPQTPSAFNPSTGSYVESQVPALSDLSSPQGAFKPPKPSTSTGYIESQHLSSLDTKRPGEQISVSQDQQGSLGPFGSYPSGTPDSSGYRPASLQSGRPGPKPNNGYLPPYRYGS
ncbi:collagen alpha-1(I) chain-like [Cimex lectularius]|uniref:Chitin-binding type-2 domain-containing protein n=1 Tax=Cimex lectularius TaxID=79782 RepID=A0A8I6S9Q5_CIMLE|nr:collagen alpha-1(I) chain-like [Cimex lectularius]XP_014259152.1 collagen alpha-1(I) chain-like [Cimex lectularius]